MDPAGSNPRCVPIVCTLSADGVPVVLGLASPSSAAESPPHESVEHMEVHRIDLEEEEDGYEEDEEPIEVLVEEVVDLRRERGGVELIETIVEEEEEGVLSDEEHRKVSAAREEEQRIPNGSGGTAEGGGLATEVPLQRYGGNELVSTPVDEELIPIYHHGHSDIGQVGGGEADEGQTRRGDEEKEEEKPDLRREVGVEQVVPEQRKEREVLITTKVEGVREELRRMGEEEEEEGEVVRRRRMELEVEAAAAQLLDGEAIEAEQLKQEEKKGHQEVRFLSAEELVPQQETIVTKTVTIINEVHASTSVETVLADTGAKAEQALGVAKTAVVPVQQPAAAEVAKTTTMVLVRQKTIERQRAVEEEEKEEGEEGRDEVEWRTGVEERRLEVELERREQPLSAGITRALVIEQHLIPREKENAQPVHVVVQPRGPQQTIAPAVEPRQNGTRTPGARSPFAQLEPPVDEDWRLSPKTLSRIKQLRVVMETNGAVGQEEEEQDGAEVIHHHPVFMKDTSRFWYKPTISREEAIAMLKNKAPGTFIVRDSNSFPGAFGLALKVAQPPAGVNSADGSELVRHFLIEPSSKGVRLKGCSNEPVFGTLAALVYQHSITPLALPCRLILPEYDPAATPEHLNSNQALLERGAACNVTFLCSVDTESLTGPEALRRSAAHCLELLQRRELRAVPVHFKVSAQGITLTDNTRSQFFRRHYPVNSVTFAGIDPESRVFDNNNVAQLPPTYVRQAPVFGFVARKNPAGDYSGSVENACHLFAELDPDQPASAVVRFITNVMMPVGRAHLHQIHQSVR